jgi:ribonuclease HII
MNGAKLYEDYQRYVDLLVEHTPKVIVGFDETGNGAIAGPLCVGACALELDFAEKVKDSKRYSSDSAREKAYNMVTQEAIAYKSFMAHPNQILKQGHGEALTSLYTEALEHMYATFGDDGLYILDGDKIVQGIDIPHTALVKADDFIPAVSAASIIAKVDRDGLMVGLQPDAWHFDKSKGYPTPEHLRFLEEMGPIEGLHRMNVERVCKAYDKLGWYKEQDHETKTD